MQRTLIRYLRRSVTNGFRAGAQRTAAALVLALILPLPVWAYTIVMRSGRRIEVPQTFTATRATLTYEHAPGIYVTLQLSSIDVAATDRANNEPGGSFLKRLGQQSPPRASGASPANGARRSITNQDLEASRRARQQSEEAYERRRTELGLPSREESLRRREEEAQRAREQLRLSEEDEAQSEVYWRSRASTLRAELAAVDGEINYLRARLAETPDYFSSGSYTVLTTVAPVLPFNRGVFHRPFPHPAIAHPFPTIGNPGIISANNMGAQITGRVGVGGGATRGQVLINPPGTITPFGQRQAATAFGLRRQVVAPVFGVPLTTFGASFPNQYYSYERDALVARLDELGARRAGLQARWRVLEDEARRAGALPGWLRP